MASLPATSVMRSHSANAHHNLAYLLLLGCQKAHVQSALVGPESYRNTFRSASGQQALAKVNSITDSKLLLKSYSQKLHRDYLISNFVTTGLASESTSFFTTFETT